MVEQVHVAAPEELGDRDAKRVLLRALADVIRCGDQISTDATHQEIVLASAWSEIQHGVAVTAHVRPTKICRTPCLIERARVRKVIGLTRRLIQCAGGEITLVRILCVVVLPGDDARGVMERKGLALLQEFICVDRSAQALLRECAVDRFVKRCRQRHDGGEIACGSRGDREDEQVRCFFLRVCGDVRKISAGDFVIDPAVVALHLQKPFKLKAHFVQHVRNAVSALRNVPIVAECFRRGPKRQKQIGNGFTSGHDIPSVVAGVVPAAGYMEERIRTENTSRRGMTCRMRKHTRAGGIERDAATLQIKHTADRFDERLCHGTPLHIASRNVSWMLAEIVRREFFVGDAFHGMRLQTLFTGRGKPCRKCMPKCRISR